MVEQFRKHKDKLIKRRSEGDEHGASGDVSTGSTLTNAESLEVNRKRSSQSLAGFIPVLSPGYGTTDQLRRNVSSSGSEAPSVGSQAGQSTHVNTASTSNPLGLTLMYTSQDPILDLIFVHGLGGTSKGTWSWKNDPTHFWPTWLNDDVELSRSRIFTFGYNAAFSGQYSISNMLDFAKDLLFRMKTYTGEYQRDTLPIGKVVHLHTF